MATKRLTLSDSTREFPPPSSFLLPPSSSSFLLLLPPRHPSAGRTNERTKESKKERKERKEREREIICIGDGNNLGKVVKRRRHGNGDVTATVTSPRQANPSLRPSARPANRRLSPFLHHSHLHIWFSLSFLLSFFLSFGFLNFFFFDSMHWIFSSQQQKFNIFQCVFGYSLMSFKFRPIQC